MQWIRFPLLLAMMLVYVTSSWTEPAYAAGSPPPGNELRVRFFSAGHGDATLLRTPAGHNILIDLGRASKEHLGDNLVKRRLLPFFRRASIRRLDAVVVTHPHWDHFGDLGRLRSEVRFDSLLVSRYTAHAFRRLRSYPRRHRHWLLTLFRHPGHDNLRYDLTARGKRHRFGKLVLEVLWPPAQGGPPAEVMGIKGHNNQSLVIRARYGKVRFLLAGDLERSGEQRLLRTSPTTPGRADVLKLGHHGSRSTSLPFLDRIRPRYAVATVGDEGPNRYDRISPRVIRNLKRHRVKLLRTDRAGDILFSTDGHRLRVQTFPELAYRPKWLQEKRARQAAQRRRRLLLLVGLTVTFACLLGVLGVRLRRRRSRQARDHEAS